MSQEERDWIDVILGLYSDLPLSNGVVRHTDGNDKKRKRIMDYLNKVQDYSKLCFTRRYSNFEKHYKNIFYYRNYVIKPFNIPDSYFDLQIRIARENGMGNISISDDEKRVITRKVIEDQKKSLDEWIDYFVHGNGRFFPIYEQYWAFQGLQKLGKYDVETGTFSKRNKNTVYPFPDLNEAALEMTLSLMEKYVKNGEVVLEIKDAFHSYNFKAIYEHCLRIVLEKDSFKSSEGQWVKYEKGSDYNILLNDLRGKHTGWCTERSAWASKYLSESDFYVFYTKDVNGNFTDPRLTIRADGRAIKEVRGIASAQNVEAEMLPILNDKLKEFDFSEDYLKKHNNMNKLTLIEKKHNDGIDLSREELAFLYEVGGIVEGFGGERDPRINEIIKDRDIVSDLAVVFNVEKDEIALDISEINQNTKVYFGNLIYEMENDSLTIRADEDDFGAACEKMIIPKFVLGDVTLYNYSEDVELPKIVTGCFSVFCPSYMKKLVLPQVGIHLSVYGLTSCDEIIMDDNECYDINFYSLKEFKKIHFPSVAKGRVVLNKMVFCDDMKLPRIIGGSLDMKSLIIAKNLEMPKVIGENLFINNLCSFDGTKPDKIYGTVYSANFDFGNDKKVIR